MPHMGCNDNVVLSLHGAQLNDLEVARPLSVATRIRISQSWRALEH